MAKFSLQEMYLTEYNRLIAALQTYFTEGKAYNTIEQWVDYLNRVKETKQITSIDLDSIGFATDDKDVTTEYTQGIYSIMLQKHDNLIEENIKKGVVIEGITGSLVDGSQIISETQLNALGGIDSVLSNLDSKFPYYYYNSATNEIKSGQGKAEPTQTGNNLTIGTDLIYNKTTERFDLDSKYENVPLKKFKVVPDNIITSVPSTGGVYNLPAGYVPTALDLPRLTDAERSSLQDNLKYGYSILGVTGKKSSIVDTLEDTSGDSNHIISGQYYWRNGIRYSGALQEKTVYDVIQSNLSSPVTNTIVPTISGNTAFSIPSNSYVKEGFSFDITNLAANNIKNGIEIMGIVGNADIVDLYEGNTTVMVGTDTPIVLADAEGNYNNATNIIPVGGHRFEEGDDIIIVPLDSDYENDIVTGKVIAGLSGTFSARSNSHLQYIAEDFNEDGTVKETETTIEATGMVVKHSESNDIALNKYAFIDGRLCRGTNTSLVNKEEYTDNYLLELADEELPTQLETKDKLLTDNIQIWINPDKINSNIIAYGSTILGIKGQYTKQDTNPITNDKILHGYVGYANGQQYTGSIPNHENKIYNSSLKTQSCNPGYYKTLTISPLTFIKNSESHTYEETGGATLIPSLIRKGWVVDGIPGTGLMLHVANVPSDVTSLVTNEEDDDVILYKGTSTGEYVNNTYYEIVKKEEEYQAAGFTLPTADKLIRSRELNEATGVAEHILSGQVVYSNRGIKLTGTMTNHGKYSYVVEPTINYTTNKITSAKGYYDSIELSVNTKAINASEIKHGVTLFGVTGTYSPTLETLNLDVPANDWSTDTEGYLIKTYTPDSSIDGWNKINIKTLIRSKDLGTVTENGTHTFDVVNHDPGAHGWNQVSFTVNVATPEPELETLQVTSNGTYSAADKGVNGWDTVVVNVSNSGAPAIPIIQDYDIYMNGTNTAWLTGGTIVFDNNLSAYYSAINGNSTIKLLNSDNYIDMSKVEVVDTILGTVKLDPLYTSDTITTTPEKHVVAYFPAGEYCLPVWDNKPSFSSMMQSAFWNLDCGLNELTRYSQLTTVNSEGSSLYCRLKNNTGADLTLFSKSTGWTRAFIQLYKPIITPNDFYTASGCMKDLSLVLNPIKQYVSISKKIFTTKDQGLNTGDEIIYQSDTIKESVSLILSNGDHVVLDIGLTPISILYSTTNNTIKYEVNSNEYIMITIKSTELSMRAYSIYPKSSVTLQPCKLIIV